MIVKYVSFQIHKGSLIFLSCVCILKRNPIVYFNLQQLLASVAQENVVQGKAAKKSLRLLES